MSERLAFVHGLVRIACDTAPSGGGVGDEFCSIALILQQGSYLSQKSHCHTPYRTILEPRNPCHRTNPGSLNPGNTGPPHQINQVHGQLGAGGGGGPGVPIDAAGAGVKNGGTASPFSNFYF